MKKYVPAVLILLELFTGLAFTNTVFAENTTKMDSAAQFFYIKKEIDKGLFIDGHNERDDLLTDLSKYSEKLYTGSTGFLLKKEVWNFVDVKQEIINLRFNIGPFFSSGNVFDSTQMEIIEADRQLFGLRAGANVNYESRFYYDSKTYTLVQVTAWARNDLFWQNSTGTKLDSDRVMSDYSQDDIFDRFRYGFQAKAGWGFGRLNPMNHYMVADYVFKNNYPRRVFSENEKEKLASKIGEVKQRRKPGVKRAADAEMREISDFLRSGMMLEAPKLTEKEWLMGEFLPRYNGSRIELGPFFNYYNREPDFYYGGFVQYTNDTYASFNWNRNLRVEGSYSHYKQHDWASIVADFGWSYFPNLKTRFGFGLKYIPGIVIYSLENMGPLRHNFVPYFEYYTQVNAMARMNFSFAWRIADSEDFMMSGPELTLSFYRSSY